MPLKSIPKILVIIPMGQGKVTSAPQGINCGLNNTQCIYSYEAGTQVRLTAISAFGWTFEGWSGGCNYQGQVYMNYDKFCLATFVEKEILLNL